MASKSAAAATSPRTTTTVVEFDFPDAMREVAHGRRLTRKEWKDDSVVMFLADGMLKIRNADGTVHNLLVSDGDLLATDWVAVREV